MFAPGSLENSQNQDVEMQELAELCEIDDLDEPESRNPYHRIVRVLTQLRQLSLTISNFDRIIAFLGEPTLEFQRLIRRKDHRALIILSYWFAIICQLSLWWARKRLRNEYLAICIFLERDSTDLRVKRLMEYPGRVCGYV